MLEGQIPGVQAGAVVMAEEAQEAQEAQETIHLHHTTGIPSQNPALPLEMISNGGQASGQVY